MRLRVFALYTTIDCDTPGPSVVHIVNTVLNTIPASNTVMNLSFDFYIAGAHPFRCFDENWVGMCDEVIRISSGKPLELDLELSRAVRGREEDELYDRVLMRTRSLLGYPNICPHFWNSTTPWYLLDQKLPRGEVRSRCRQ